MDWLVSYQSFPVLFLHDMKKGSFLFYAIINKSFSCSYIVYHTMCFFLWFIFLVYWFTASISNLIKCFSFSKHVKSVLSLYIVIMDRILLILSLKRMLPLAFLGRLRSRGGPMHVQNSWLRGWYMVSDLFPIDTVRWNLLPGSWLSLFY